MSEQSGVRGSVPWSGTARNGMPGSRPYVWRRQDPVVRCPDHPGRELSPLPGGGARGICPVDGASHQMDAPEPSLIRENFAGTSLVSWGGR